MAKYQIITLSRKFNDSKLLAFSFELYAFKP